MAATVLVVDDSRNIREFCRRMLELEGYRVLLAGTAQEAQALMRWGRPDVVILDVRMPHISGLEVIEEIAAAAPVILFTAHRDSLADGRARLARVRLPKSEDLTELKAQVARLVAEDRCRGAQPRDRSLPHPMTPTQPLTTPPRGVEEER